MRRLIVNADDFGLTNGINRAVATLHDIRSLTSATLMASANRLDDAVEIAQRTPSLGVGCHLVLVDGVPLSDPASIPSLLTAPGPGRPAFRRSLGVFVRDLLAGRISHADIEREATAQILRLQHAGLIVTHIDTHKHTHMFPAVLDAVTRAAKACGVQAIRNPFEPRWSVAATPLASSLRRMQVNALRSFAGNFHRTIRHQGMHSTDGCLGVVATGSLNEACLQSIVERMPAGTWELVCHPAFIDDELRQTPTRLQESRETELSALRLFPEILARSSADIDLIHFGNLVS